jgi:biopolymer transport protein ExbD
MIDFEMEETFLEDSKSGPDLTPMIDMVFILLVFFLLTSVFVLPAINVDLPEADSGEAPEQIELTVSIDREGTIFLNKETVPKAELESRLLSAAAEGEIEEVFLQADDSIQFGSIVDIIDIVRSTGIGTVSFVVEQE